MSGENKAIHTNKPYDYGQDGGWRLEPSSVNLSVGAVCYICLIIFNKSDFLPQLT
jgi:hypothetical protein